MFHITLYLENDIYKPVVFKEETLICTCQLSKNHFFSTEKMNLVLLQSKNKTKELLLSLTKSCEGPTEQPYQ